MFKTLLAALCIILYLATPLSAHTDNPETCWEEDSCSLPPVISCPAFVWLKPSESAHPNRTGHPAAYPGGPDCETPIVTYTDEVFVINACHKIYTRIWTATDPNDPTLVDTCHQTIKQVDEEAPTWVSLVDDIMIYTSNMDPATQNCKTQISWIEPLVYDNHILESLSYEVKVNGQIVDVLNGDLFMNGSYVVTYTAQDFCGNINKQEFTVDVMCADCHLSCPDMITLPLGSDISPATTGTAEAYSGNMNCGAVNVSYSDKLIETGCHGSTKTLRSWRGEFVNMPGEYSTCAQMILVQDMTAIELHNCPADVNVPNNHTVAQWTEPTVTSSNNNNTLTLTSNYSPGHTFPVGITTIIYTAVDDCGSEATCSFKLSVLSDANYPDCPEDIELECDADGTVVADWTAPKYTEDCETCGEGDYIYGFMYVGSFNGSHYYCSRKNYSYADAKRKAHENGGYLVSIDTEKENEFVAAHIGSATAFIGLTDVYSEGNFIWDDGSSLSYENWYLNQPNDTGNQDYVEIMRSGLWNDVDNASVLEFIMEIPCNPVTQISGPKPGDKLTSGTYTVKYRIHDGCGLEQFCEFDIIVREKLAVVCPDDIFVEVPSSEEDITIVWDLPQVTSCCCADAASCVKISQTEGPPSGSVFLRQSKTPITYTIQDDCGSEIICSFLITVDIDVNSGRLSNDFLGPNAASVEIQVTQSEDELVAPTPATPITDKGVVEDTAIKIFPNPVLTNLHLEIPFIDQVNTVRLFDVSGQMMQKIYLDKSKSIIDMNAYSKGVYILVISRNDGKITSHKLIKS